MIGVFLAIILSVAFGVLLEKLDQTIKSQRLVQDVFGELPLAVIPHMMTKSDLRSAMKSKILVVVGVIATVGILTVVVHFSYLPIDVVWYMALRKIS
jgi:succinoglycan biosynthesis transport protein ExoP